MEELLEKIKAMPSSIEPFNEWETLPSGKIIYHNRRRLIVRLDDVIKLIKDYGKEKQ